MIHERVLLGGMTCDSDDYYNSAKHECYHLPKYNKENHYIGFFNTGAYQETIGGYGGLHHCLIPQPKHILIDRDENGILATEVFSEQQTSQDVLKILGLTKNKFTINQLVNLKNSLNFNFNVLIFKF
jgi:arginine decarboxylase